MNEILEEASQNEFTPAEPRIKGIKKFPDLD